MPSVLRTRWALIVLLAFTLLAVLISVLATRRGDSEPTRPAKLAGLILFWRDTPWPSLDAQWSPEGTRVSYSSYRHTGEADEWLGSSIWTVAAKGGDPAMLGLGFGARWSPDGKQLAFSAPTRESDGDLFVMNADGSARRRLLATPELEQAADWSPDGSKILFTQHNTSGSDVMVVDVDGANVRTFSDLPGFDVAGAWSPDGSTIVYERQGRWSVLLDERRRLRRPRHHRWSLQGKRSELGMIVAVAVGERPRRI